MNAQSPGKTTATRYDPARLMGVLLAPLIS